MNHWIWKLLRMSGMFVREFFGWALMLWGLNVFRITFQYFNIGAVIEGCAVAAIGALIFRSGLQLVKVAVAARALRVEHASRYNPSTAARTTHASSRHAAEASRDSWATYADHETSPHSGEYSPEHSGEYLHA